MLHLVLCECGFVWTCMCVYRVANQNTKCEVYPFGLSLFFVPERKCNAVLRSYAFIWKIGQFLRESLSPCFCPSLFHALPADICLSFSLPISFLICPIVLVFTPTSLIFYFLRPFSLFLTFQSFSHLLPAFSLSLYMPPAVSLLWHLVCYTLTQWIGHSVTCKHLLVHAHPHTHCIPTHTHLTLVCSLHLIISLLPYSWSFSCL